MKISEFNYNEKKGKGIYIYGATVGGCILRQLLTREGVVVLGYCDRSYNGEIYDGLPLIAPINLPDNAIVIIALMRSFESACYELERNGITKVFHCASIVRGVTLSDLNIDDKDTMLGESFLNDYPIYSNRFLVDGKIILPALELFITEKCTLRCRDCSHLIPYYQNPENHPMTEVIHQLTNLLFVVSGIKELLILGGEPFLHPDLDKLLYWAYNNDQIDSLRIITNGTVFPTLKIWSAIRDTKTQVRISDYGKLSINTERIKKYCVENNISCSVNQESWTDMGSINNHNYSINTLRNMFKNCPFSNLYLLISGRLFRCAHIAHINNLKYANTFSIDSIDFSTDHTADEIGEQEKTLVSFFDIDHLEGCRYCNGYSNSAPCIPPAIQLSSNERGRFAE